MAREHFRIVLATDFWARRSLVVVEPRVATHPTRSFVDPEQAERFADELSRVEGWPVHDIRRASGEERHGR